MKRNKRAFGFTLVEIMIVVTIIGILASLAVPAFQKARWKAVETSIRNNLRQMWGAAQQYMLENGVDNVNTTTIIGWSCKGSTGINGTNEGYTSVLQQVASEDYSKIKSTRACEVLNPLTKGADSASGVDGFLYEDSSGIQLQVDTCRYVKLVL